MDESAIPAVELERWLPVPDYEGLYEVSSLGHVCGLDRMIRTVHGNMRLWRGRVIKPRMGERYLIIGLWRDGEPRTFFVHLLVARAFLGAPPEGHEVCHGPAGNLDNSLANLSYGTRAKNNGPDKDRDGTHGLGTRNPQAKLTDEIVRECRARAAAGESQHSLARAFGVSQGAIRLAVIGVTWRHVA